MKIPHYCFILKTWPLTKNFRLYPVPDEDTWRVGMASEVLDTLHGDAFVSEFVQKLKLMFCLK